MSTICRRILVAALGAAALVLPGCDSGRKTIHVFAADSLAISFRDVERAFEKAHPDIDVRLEIMGSILACRLVPLRRGDVLAVADHRLIEKILSPRHAAWVAKFAGTEIVIAAHTSSARRAEINANTWYDLLLRPDIRYGYADPGQDPCGYYTRLTWELAQKYYFASRGQDRPLARQLVDGCPQANIALDANRLISDYLKMARIDYAFVYRVHAIDQKLPYVALPKEINLGDPSLASYYASVQANVPDYRGSRETFTGCPIAYGVTVLNDAPNAQGAREFVRYVLSKEGQDILKRSGFESVQPALVPKWGAVPDFLGDLAKAEE